MVRSVIAGCALAAAISMSSAVKADVIMDATTHNGGLYAEVTGTYWDNATTNPAEWFKTGSHVYNGASFIQAYPSVQVFNNTGETVDAGYTYTLSADIGDRAETNVDVYVRATENIDGTGEFSNLAHVGRSGQGDESTFAFFTLTNTGAPAAASLDGYFIQVLVVTGETGSGQNHYFDNLVVTSEVPEPASLALLLASGAVMLRRKRHATA